MIRSPTHAGSWYNDDSNQLKDELTNYISRANAGQANGHLKAIIGPHAGYRYSGETAGVAYKSIDPNRVQRVFLLGPSHKVYSDGGLISPFEYFGTPLGPIKIDEEVREALVKSGQFQLMTQQVDLNEHSLEMHAPFLQYMMSQKSNGPFTLVPIMIGSPSTKREAGMAESLIEYFEDPSNLFIISSDFCHWGSRFDYTYQDESPIHEFIEKLDLRGIELICSLNYTEFRKYLAETENTICGRNPILLFLKIVSLSERLQLTGKCLAYDQSSKVVRPNESSVSYAALVFFSE